MQKEGDRVQDMLPQNRASRHTEYFKLTEFEKQHVQEELSDLPLKEVIRPSCERCPPYTWGKGESLSLKTEGH